MGDATDSLILHIASRIEHGDGTPNYDLDYIGACADDLGLKVKSIDMLRQISEPLAAAEELALFSQATQVRGCPPLGRARACRHCLRPGPPG